MKSKAKAFPFGSTQEKKEDLAGKQPPQEVRSDRKEAKMALDEEGKQYVKNALSPIEAKLGIVDKVAQDTEASKSALATLKVAVEAIKESLPARQTNEEKGKGATGLSAEDVRRIVTEYDESKEERRERDRKTRERELKVEGFDKRITDVERKQEEFNKYKEKCEKDGDPVACGRVDSLKKEVEAARKSLSAEEKVELEALEKMSGEKRDAMTEEQSKARDASVEPILSRFNISDNDLARKILKDKVNVDNLVKKPVLREAVLETFSPEERVKVVEGACKDDVCLVKFREGGYSMLKQDKDGKWKPVDKEVAKQMTPLF